MLFLCSWGLLKEKRRTSNKERKLGDTFFFLLFSEWSSSSVGKRSGEVGLLGLQKRIWEGFSERRSVSVFRYLKGLHQGGKKKVIYFHKIETLGPACNKKDVEQTEGKTSHPPP